MSESAADKGSELDEASKKAAETDAAKTETVSYDTHKKLLDEKKKLQEKLDAADRTAKADAEKKLKEKEEFKALYENTAKEAEELKAKNKALNDKITDSRKLTALVANLSAEIPHQYFNLVDLEKISVDENGKPEEASVKKFARDFEKNYPEIFAKKENGKMPNEAAKGGSAKLSHEEWSKLPYAEKQKRMKDVELE